MLDQPSPGTITETGMIKNHPSAADATPGDNQDNTKEMEPRATAGPSTLQLSTNDDSDSAAFYDRERDEASGSIDCALFFYGDLKNYFISDNSLQFPNRTDTDCVYPRFNSSYVCTEGSRVQDACELLSVQPGIESGGDGVLVEMEAPVTAVNCSVTDTQQTHSHLQTSSSDPGRSKRASSCLPRSHSVPSLSQITSAKNQSFTRAESLPAMLLKSSFEEFTPDIAADENDETYRFQCSCPGLYQCSVTGLVFHMEGAGDVVYRVVPWNRRLLAQHHKQPAGPLFDIQCLQQSVCQLHLPHCEIRSTGGCEFLSVAHVNDEGMEFIGPRKITETHVIINITGFSGFGNVKDEDSPPDPVRALVLLFYRPPADPDPTSLLNVLLLPRNVVLRDVLRTRKKLVGDELYVETSPHCKLHPKQEYTLSTCPEDDSVLVQPTEAEFDCDDYDNYYLPSFQVSLDKIMKHIKLFLRDTNSSHSVWERRVCLSSSGVRRSCGPSALNLPPNERLSAIRSSFIDGISGPVLKSLLDKLNEKTVLADSEREAADEMQHNRDKARFVIDTVRKKGEAAGSEMIECLCEMDPFLCEHLDLI
ncbi:LOW QUALITY PROTEIN: NACHT, LRR and PYD domains-containing protein 1b allele 2-like [Siniperca chuatsi]|uniref:LOW QUALITY PROTEIN: NACHT, LRR and PYD domains-containing protein 1b allele 2-like n=1 Tax=Siniperca chuatsi TaxID=119488 RepID=UPI001CE1F33D|nr:LOW QUALITY PROTEIN: NACHT, LRR and PYD domains-containing protein 1b allele 2-like [Siniperca chuatsi]